MWLHRYLSSASAQLLGKLLSIIMGVLLARYLGPEEFGKYSLFMSIVAFCMLFASFGLPQLLAREVSVLKAKCHYAKLKGMVCWSYIASVTITFLMLIIFSCFYVFYPQKVPIGLLVFVSLCLIVIFKVFTSINSGVLNGDKKPFHAILGLNVIYPLVCVLFMLYQGKALTYDTMLMGAVLATMVGFFTSLFYLYKLSFTQWSSSSMTFPSRRLFKKLYPFGVLAFLTTFNTEFAGMILGFLGHPEQLALFKVSMQAITLITLIFTIISNVNSPYLAEAYAKNQQQVAQSFLIQSANLGFICSLPILFGLLFFGKSVLIFVFGDAYSQAYPILVILLIGQLVRVFMGIPGVALNMSGYEKHTSYIMFFSVLLLTMSLFTLVPHIGALGAAISVAMSTVFWSVTSSYALYKKTGLKTWVNLTLKEK